MMAVTVVMLQLVLVPYLKSRQTPKRPKLV